MEPRSRSRPDLLVPLHALPLFSVARDGRSRLEALSGRRPGDAALRADPIRRLVSDPPLRGLDATAVSLVGSGPRQTRSQRFAVRRYVACRDLIFRRAA